MSLVQEAYTPVLVGVNATVAFSSNRAAGFIAVTSGTLTISRLISTGYDPLITALPVTAGVYTPFPSYLSHLGGQVVAAGGASGVFFVS